MPRYAVIDYGVVKGVLNASTPPTISVPAGRVFVDITNLPSVVGGERYDPISGVFFSAEGIVGTEVQKAQFLTALQAQMSELGRILEKAGSLTQVFVDRGYDAAASDPITDLELADYGVIQYDLGIAINVMQQLSKLFSGQATTPSAAYDAAVSKWRQL